MLYGHRMPSNFRPTDRFLDTPLVPEDFPTVKLSGFSAAEAGAADRPSSYAGWGSRYGWSDSSAAYSGQLVFENL